MLYIANVDVTVYHYRGSTESLSELFTVNASSAAEAEDKIEEHFRRRSSEFSVYYNVINTVFATHIE